VGSLAAELADHNPSARRELASSFSIWEEAISAVIDGLKARGRIQSTAPTPALATATLAAIQGGLLLSKTARDPAPLRTSLDANYRYLRSFAAGGAE
jgi:hypothetical protein